MSWTTVKSVMHFKLNFFFELLCFPEFANQFLFLFFKKVNFSLALDGAEVFIELFLPIEGFRHGFLLILNLLFFCKKVLLMLLYRLIALHVSWKYFIGHHFIIFAQVMFLHFQITHPFLQLVPVARFVENNTLPHHLTLYFIFEDFLVQFDFLVLSQFLFNLFLLEKIAPVVYDVEGLFLSELDVLVCFLGLEFELGYSVSKKLNISL